MIVPTDLYCHGCGKDFIAKLDFGLNGNHEIKCPHCSHIHYRVIENGEVTGDRYRSSMQTYYSYTYTVVYTAAVANTSKYSAIRTSGTSNPYLSDSWLHLAYAS